MHLLDQCSEGQSCFVLAVKLLVDLNSLFKLGRREGPKENAS